YWAANTLAPDQIRRQRLKDGAPMATIDQEITAWNGRVSKELLSAWLWHLPLTDVPPVNTVAPFYGEWARHPDYADYWASMDLETRFADVKVPALISGAWYDPFQAGTISSFKGMLEHGGTDVARSATKLVMTAYGHSGDSGTPTFGKDTGDPDVQRRFF